MAIPYTQRLPKQMLMLLEPFCQLISLCGHFAPHLFCKCNPGLYPRPHSSLFNPRWVKTSLQKLRSRTALHNRFVLHIHGAARGQNNSSGACPEPRWTQGCSSWIEIVRELLKGLATLDRMVWLLVKIEARRKLHILLQIQLFPKLERA